MVGLWLDRAQKASINRADFRMSPPMGDVARCGALYPVDLAASTKEVGCALAANAESDFLVCRYSPPGNWMGQFAIPQAPAKRR
jgi:hypothetical protein